MKDFNGSKNYSYEIIIGRLKKLFMLKLIGYATVRLV